MENGKGNKQIILIPFAVCMQICLSPPFWVYGLAWFGVHHPTGNTTIIRPMAMRQFIPPFVHPHTGFIFKFKSAQSTYLVPKCMHCRLPLWPIHAHASSLIIILIDVTKILKIICLFTAILCR